MSLLSRSLHQPLRDGSSSPRGSKREYIKRLWKAFFANPTEWWDYRLFKRNPKAPDFQHKATQDKLWLDGTRNPSWVYPLLAKRDKECPCPPYAVPAPMLEEYKKEEAPIPALGTPKSKQTKKAQTTDAGITENCLRQSKNNKHCHISDEIPMPQPNKKKEARALGRISRTPIPALGNLTLKQGNKSQNSVGGNTEAHVTQPKKVNKDYAIGEVSILNKRKKEEASTAHVSGKSPPAVRKPQFTQTKKIWTVCEDINAKNAEIRVKRSSKNNKGNTIGKVCDWHALSVEDSIHALENGLFSEPTVETLSHIVCKCTKKKDKHYASRLLAYLQHNGLESHEVLGNYVVSMLVEVESMHHARPVFDKLATKNECTWNTIIMGYSKNRESQQVIDLYRVMRQVRTLSLSEYNFVALLRACTSLRDAKTGRLVHADAARDGLLKRNIYVGNTLLDMYSKCGSLSEAQDVFNMLPARNVITWTSLIVGYAQHECGIEALKLFKLMQNSGVPPNAFTYSSVLKVCGSLNNAAMGMELHARVEEEGFLASSQIVGNALVDMYAKCGLLTKAQEVFDLLPAHDVVSWNALITGYTEHAHFSEAILCFDKMTALGISPNAITFASCLKACANARAIDKGEEIHLEIRARGLIEKDLVLGSSLVDMYAKCGLLDKAEEVFAKLPVKDNIAWASLIAGYTQHDDCEKALACFKQMRSKDAALDAVAYISVLKACSSIGAIAMGNELYNDVDREGLLAKNPALRSAVVDMFTKFGMLGKAHEVFMASPVRDVVSWTALIAGFALLGEAEKAFYLFHKMREDLVNATSVTILAVLQACTNEGLVDVAVGLVEGMKENCCITPTLEHCTCVIDLLGRVGQINRVATLLFNIPVHPNVVMWLTLLGACQKWGHTNLAAVAFEQVVLLDDSEVSAYVCLSNIYADASMPQEISDCN